MFVLLIRTILVYICVILAIRIMGKRQLGELQPNELVVAIIISNIATLSLQDSRIPILGTVLPIFTLVACEVLVSFWSLKSVAVRRLVSGNPVIIIRDGEIDQHELNSLRWTLDDLLEQLRNNGVFDIAEVSFAIVETSGLLSVCLKADCRPISMKLSRETPDDAPPVVLISDSNISDDGLRYCGINKAWLDGILSGRRLSPADIFVMTCNRRLEYNIVEKEDKKQ